MTEKRTEFAKKEDGAVTVDWVVLTAAVMTIAVGALITIQSETVTLSESAGAEIIRKAQELGD